eukprot:TRINITY_DN1843_c0_g1_i1.p1 TRINITY_DN1843_c0_g1~~TRINITY_DN1843_c0_g1_i1.p1  ORF type:complete len:201 (-),score=43.92 TRINITY_DN1843_c0_g1_i1:177-752(-)
MGCRSSSDIEESFTIQLVGLDNSGKTTLKNKLCGRTDEIIVPTLGFDYDDFKDGRFNIRVHDLGGAAIFRDTWKYYLDESFGFIYVVDAADEARLKESSEVFENLLKNKSLSAKPILILGNKTDLPDCIDEAELSRIFNLCTKNDITFSIHMVSLINDNIERDFKKALHWLYNSISTRYDQIQATMTEFNE